MSSSAPTPAAQAAPDGAALRRIDALQQALGEVLARDEPALRKRLAGLRRRALAGRPVDRGLPALDAEVERSRAAVAARGAAVPAITYPGDLPVSGARDTIAAALAEHQVVVVCGDTGSGKSTQLPKLCLELGLGRRGAIGHTQPRRLAARGVAARVAAELGAPVGGLVGYKVRFNDRVGHDTQVKLMTDGILLAETQSDPELRQYQTLIIDEAHERSLNVDFLLGYLKRLLPRRPDLRVIITSATIEPARFAAHFDGAPVVSVEGRTYPVEVRYRPLAGEDEESRDRDLQEAVVDAVQELAAEGPGDFLVFLSGEREIRETAEALRKRRPRGSEVLPLFARLSGPEQDRIFQTGGPRRIVLATNVAETSVTVPGIRYVVDSGVARISRYSYRSKINRLPVEPVSQASADQRKGRCGRVGPGICVRLYAEDDYCARPRYGTPEIQRTNLAAVILQMAALGLGRVEDFPFLDPPDPRYVRDGYRLLGELQAVDAGHRLTPLGRELARLPVDPRLGRMLLAAAERGALREVLVIASALSVQDPRDRPMDARQQADAAHAEFADPGSDFLSYLGLWRWFHEQSRHLSRSKLRQACRERFVSHLRMREWHDIHQQLLGLLHDRGHRLNDEPATGESIHQALLAGLLGNIGVRRREDRSYLGARNSRFQLWPGSSLAGRGPKWVVAAEIVETSRVYARTVARINPAWVEPLAGHLVHRSHGEPRWDSRRGQVVATERVTLYGLPLVNGRTVPYAPIDPEAAREIFIREALVQAPDAGPRGAAFLRHNQVLLAELQELEHKARRRDLVVDEEALTAFYERAVPAGICDWRALERWRRRAAAGGADPLRMRREDLLERAPQGLGAERFPDTLEVEGQPLALRYRFEPGHAEDGVTLAVPLAMLNKVSPAACDWLVPGLVEEKLTQLIKSLPKVHRRRFVPAPDFARAVLQAVTPGGQGILAALSAELERMTGVAVPDEAWRPGTLPAHLHMRFELHGPDGGVLDAGRDLEGLQAAWAERARTAFSRAAAQPWQRERILAWDFGDLPETVELDQAGVRLRGYPALADQGTSVAIQVLDRPGVAAAVHRRGLRRLYALQLKDLLRPLGRRIPDLERLCLLHAGLPAPPAATHLPPGRGACDELRDQLLLAAVEGACAGDGAPVRTREAFHKRLDAGRSRLAAELERRVALVGEVLQAQRAVSARLADLEGGEGPRGAAAADLRTQLGRLVYRGFVDAVDRGRLEQYPRYLRAAELRLRRLADNPARDARLMAELAPLLDGWDAICAAPGADAPEAECEALRWLLEELRVSLFAQELGTPAPVSAKRLRERLAWAGRPGSVG